MADDDRHIYDVALSFRWGDIETVRELYTLLRDRLEVFFADEKQEIIIGTDGEKTFGEVFRDQARVVVIFYRKSWGQSTFTRAEEAGIRQRAGADGYDFTLWVMMEPEERPPAYVPLQLLNYDIQAYGMQGLAAVVERKVREAGIKVRERTVLDEVADLRRQRELAIARKNFVRLDGGAGAYLQECVKKVKPLLESKIAELKTVDPELADLRVETPGLGTFSLMTPKYQMRVELRQRFTNTVEGAYIETFQTTIRY